MAAASQENALVMSMHAPLGPQFCSMGIGKTEWSFETCFQADEDLFVHGACSSHALTLASHLG